MKKIISLLNGHSGILLVFVLFIKPAAVISQPEKKFDFSAEWKWENLIEYVVLSDPSLMKEIDRLKKEIQVTDARIILKQLTELKSPLEFNNLSNISSSDFGNSAFERNKWDSIFHNPLIQIQPGRDIESLLKTMELLSSVRKSNTDGEMFSFRGREYLPQPLKNLSNKIEMKFDFSGCDEILNYYGNNQSGEIPVEQNFLKGYTDAAEFTRIISGMQLMRLLSESSVDIPIYNIYKWINPQSYKNFGGIFLYRNDFRKVINKLKDNESNIKSDIDKHISKYLNDSTFFDTEIFFVFGNDTPGGISGKNKIYVALEHFGDNYDYIVRYLIHNIVKVAEKEIQIQVYELVPEFQDREFISLLSKIMENGIANYIGPVGTETRPWDLLEKDFQHFNKTYKSIQENSGRRNIDRLIEIGFSGNAPFYTMSTQMAYIIENTLGRSSLIESISLGPVSFFMKYIKAYSEYKKEIRRVFRFSSSVEKKIKKLSLQFPDEVIKEALRIKNSNEGSAEKTRLAEKFVKTKPESSLKYFMAGEILLESGVHEKASEFFIEGMKMKKDKQYIAGQIGQAFEENGGPEHALDFYNLNVINTPEDYKAYEMRGNFFYRAGEFDKALSDYEAALKYNPGSLKIENIIETIKTKGN